MYLENVSSFVFIMDNPEFD